jgi:N utilization substance protein A
VSEEELSKAIGRKGQNARLTSRLIGYDLVIEKDEHAKKVFEGHMGGAAHQLVAALGITDAEAVKLTSGGVSEISVLDDMGMEDVAEILDGNTDRAQIIIDKYAAWKSPASVV